MARSVINLDTLSETRKRELDRLTRAPAVAWPTVTMCAILVSTYAAVYYLGFTGQLSLWIGMLINTIVGYLSFSINHDALHRAVSTNTRLNDWIGEISLTTMLPYVDLKLFRWAHIRHHRFANGEHDPDKHFKGSAWTLPLRWMVIDIVYLFHALNHGDKVSRPALHASLRRAVVFFGLVGALIWAGYGMEVLMLWFVPIRLVSIMLGFSFFWLPHVPHDVSQQEHFTRATTVRKGFESLLGPLLQYQNYHLIHHLFPGTPFYNNYKVFKLIEPELSQYELAVQHGLDIQPTIKPGLVAKGL